MLEPSVRRPNAWRREWRSATNRLAAGSTTNAPGDHKASAEPAAGDDRRDYDRRARRRAHAQRPAGKRRPGGRSTERAGGDDRRPAVERSREGDAEDEEAHREEGR